MHDAAAESAARTFGTFLDAYAPGPVQYDTRALHFECPLFGDGFGAETAPQLQQAILSPRGSKVLRILPWSIAEAASNYSVQHQLQDRSMRQSKREVSSSIS